MTSAAISLAELEIQYIYLLETLYLYLCKYSTYMICTYTKYVGPQFIPIAMATSPVNLQIVDVAPLRSQFCTPSNQQRGSLPGETMVTLWHHLAMCQN